MQSWTDYILGTDRRLFGNVSVRDPRHKSDHYMVLGCLYRSSLRDHARYLGGHKILSLRPSTELERDYNIFAALRRAILKLQAQEALNNTWILATTWRLVDKRVPACQDIAEYQVLIWRLGRAINPSLRVEKRRRAEEAGAEVETLLGSDPPLHQEAWHRIKGWYKDAVEHAPPPAWVTLDQITT